MIKRHYSLSYIFHKLRLGLLEFRKPDLPWLTKDAVNLLNQLILPTDNGLEFGSGRSTSWLAGRCAKLVSVESDDVWYNKVKRDLRSRRNVEYHLKVAEKSAAEQSPYLDVFDQIEDQSIDFILNDGKIRDLVALRSMCKLRYGGLLIIDNAERYLPNSLKIPESLGNGAAKNENWKRFLAETNTWRRIWTSNGVTSTLILIKS
jgi:predicted O-methyltransferase YrrM